MTLDWDRRITCLWFVAYEHGGPCRDHLMVLVRCIQPNYIHLFSICFRSVILSCSHWTGSLVGPLTHPLLCLLSSNQCVHMATGWRQLPVLFQSTAMKRWYQWQKCYHLPFMIIFVLLLSLLIITLPDWFIWEGLCFIPLQFRFEKWQAAFFKLWEQGNVVSVKDSCWQSDPSDQPLKRGAHNRDLRLGTVHSIIGTCRSDLPWICPSSTESCFTSTSF